MDFGHLLDESSSFDVMDAAVDAGINHFDTADVYGGPQAADMTQGYGVSEEVIGRWLKRTGRRDEIVLATKVYQPMGLGPNDRRLSAYHLRRACEASLRRLDTDHIDLYQMHHVDRATPWEEIWQAMEQLVRDGKVTYVGSSNFAAWDVAWPSPPPTPGTSSGSPPSSASTTGQAVRRDGARARPALPGRRPDRLQPAARWALAGFPRRQHWVRPKTCSGCSRPGGHGRRTRALGGERGANGRRAGAAAARPRGLDGGGRGEIGHSQPTSVA